MIQAEHCDLCEFPKRDLKSGLNCGLTNRKPDFKTSCPDIKFSNSFKEYLPELLYKIELIKGRKKKVYLEFIVLGVIGLTILFGNYSRFLGTNLLDLSYSNYLHVIGTLLIFFTGLLFVSWAFRIFNSHKKKINKLESEKMKIELVLSNYKIDIETILNLKK